MLTEAKLRRICVQANTGTALLQDLPQTYQWVNILRTAVKHLANPYRIMGLEFCPGAIFTGPEGNGRHSHANALANNLVAKGGYNVIIGIHGSDLDFEDVDDLYCILDYLENIAVGSGYAVLILDQPELSKHSLRFQNQVLRLQQSLLKDKKTLFIIVITKSAEDVADGLLAAFPRYHCPKPSAAAVSAFVDNMLKKPVPIRIDKVSKPDILNALKNCSWKQLVDLHTQLLRMIVFHYQLNYKNYKTNGYTEEQVYEEGHIKLSGEAVKAVLSSISAQNPLVTMPMVQTVAVEGGFQPQQAVQTICNRAASDAVTIDDVDTNDAIGIAIKASDDPVGAFMNMFGNVPEDGE